jgi:hypothetical protein
MIRVRTNRTSADNFGVDAAMIVGASLIVYIDAERTVGVRTRQLPTIILFIYYFI